MKKSTIRLEEVYLDALVKENPSFAADITDKSVEHGVDISDHMKMEPATVTIIGTIVNDGLDKLDILKNYQKESKLLTYYGKSIYKNMVISNLNIEHEVNTDGGYSYDIRLKQVTISRPESIKIKVHKPETKKTDSKIKSKVKKKTNVGRRQPQKKNLSSKSKEKISKRAKENANAIKKRYDAVQMNARAVAQRINKHGDL